jgi:hypothetical protein
MLGPHAPNYSDGGMQGLRVDKIAEYTKVDPAKLARVLRLLATNHVFIEVTPDTFCNNRLSSMLDTGKAISEIVNKCAALPLFRHRRLILVCPAPCRKNTEEPLPSEPCWSICRCTCLSDFMLHLISSVGPTRYLHPRRVSQLRCLLVAPTSRTRLHLTVHSTQKIHSLSGSTAMTKPHVGSVSASALQDFQ